MVKANRSVHDVKVQDLIGSFTVDNLVEVNRRESRHIAAVIHHRDAHEDVVDDSVDRSDQFADCRLRVSLSIHLYDTRQR